MKNLKIESTFGLLKEVYRINRPFQDALNLEQASTQEIIRELDSRTKFDVVCIGGQKLSDLGEGTKETYEDEAFLPKGYNDDTLFTVALVPNDMLEENDWAYESQALFFARRHELVKELFLRGYDLKDQGTYQSVYLSEFTNKELIRELGDRETKGVFFLDAVTLSTMGERTSLVYVLALLRYTSWPAQLREGVLARDRLFTAVLIPEDSSLYEAR